MPSPHRETIRPLGQRRISPPHRERALRGDTAGWPLAAPLLVLVAGWVLMVWPWLSGRVTIPWDAKAQFLPQIQFLAQSIARGESPFWAPFVFSGQNQIADPQSMIFSPPFLLLALVDGNPSGWAVDVTTLLAELAGAAALLVWFRDRGWHWAGAIIAGLAFAFGASMAWRIQHTGQVLSLAYWPMALLALDRMLTRRSFVYALVLGGLGAAIILGRDQVALLVLYLLAAYGVWRLFDGPEPWTRALRRALPQSVLAVLTAVALAGIPVLLTALMATGSNRPSIDFEGAGRGSLHPALLITALIPHLFGAAFRMEDYWGPPSFAWSDTGLYIAQNMGQIYIGVLPVLLIVLATVRGQLWAREVRFFTIALALIVLYALGWYTPFFRLAYLLPGVDLYRRPADATFVVGALGAILAGYATHRFFATPWEHISARAWQVLGGVMVAALLFALAVAIRIDRVSLLSYPLLAAAVSMIAATAALLLARQRLALEPWTAALILCGVTALDLAWNNGPSSSSGLPPSAYAVFEPNTADPVISALKAHVEAGRTDTRRDRIELLGLGYHWPNASLSHRLENTLGANPVRQELYASATGAEDTIGQPDQRTFTPLLPSYRSHLVDLLGLRYVAAGAPLEKVDPKLKPGDWTLLGKVGEAWLYENPRALPRIAFARRVIGADFDALPRTGVWPAYDPSTAVLLPSTHGTYYSNGGITGDAATRVSIIRYANDAVEIDAQSATGGYVVLRDLWHPWWFAEIDGKPAVIERADVLFRAVEVPPGAHRIRFAFRPLQGAWNQLRHREW